MISYEKMLVIFGGIHELTHEKNDINIFHIEAKKWILAESETKLRKNSVAYDGKHSRNHPGKSKNLDGHHIDHKNDYISILTSDEESSSITHGTAIRKTTKKMHDNSNISGTKALSPKFQKYKPDSNLMTSIDDERSKSPSNIHKNQVQDPHAMRKDKDLQMRKLVMLAVFDIPENEKHKFRNNSPTTLAMKDSIENTGIQNGIELGRRKSINKTDFINLSPLKNSQPITSNKTSGHKPCARDGHSATIFEGKLMIYGGDRHKMCFNDLYSLDLSYLNKFK